MIKAVPLGNVTHTIKGMNDTELKGSTMKIVYWIFVNSHKIWVLICSMCIIFTVSHQRLTPQRCRKLLAHDSIKGCIIAWAESWIFISHYILWRYGSGFWSCIWCTIIRQNDLPSIFSVFSSKGARIHSWKGKMVVWFRALDEHSDLSPIPGSAIALLCDLAQSFLHASVSPKMG